MSTDENPQPTFRTFHCQDTGTSVTVDTATGEVHDEAKLLAFPGTARAATTHPASDPVFDGLEIQD